MAITKLRFGLLAGAAGLAAFALAASTSRKNLWQISHGKRGYAVEFTRAPTWAILVEDSLEQLPCMHPRRGWTWRVGFGAEVDGIRRWSLGRLLTNACDARHQIVAKTEQQVGSIPIDRDTAVAIEPEAVAEIDRIFADD